MNRICACMGPQFNEPYCPCLMESKGLKRSPEWIEYHNEQNTAIRMKKLNEAIMIIRNELNITHTQ